MTSLDEGQDIALAARYERWREWINSYKARTSFGWAQIGHEVGKAESSMALFGSGRYPIANSAKLLDQVEAFAKKVEAREREIPRQSFVMTSIARGVNDVIWQTQLLRSISVISGDSGIGKSQAVLNHVSGSPSAAYVALNPQARTAKPLMLKMLAAIKRPQSRHTPPFVLFDMLVHHTRDSHWYFVIDEANDLSREALNTLRCYQDESHTPIVLVRNMKLYENARWTGGRDAFESAASFTQFDSRCAIRKHFTASDIRSADARAIAEQLIGAELTRSCAELLVREARAATSGALRALVTILRKAHMNRRDLGQPLTKADIELAIEQHNDDTTRQKRHAA